MKKQKELEKTSFIAVGPNDSYVSSVRNHLIDDFGVELETVGTIDEGLPLIKEGKPVFVDRVCTPEVLDHVIKVLGNMEMLGEVRFIHFYKPNQDDGNEKYKKLQEIRDLLEELEGCGIPTYFVVPGSGEEQVVQGFDVGLKRDNFITE